MTTANQKDWRKEFGIAASKPPRFYRGKEELGPSTPQAHIIRRAFDLLDLDGVLCADNSPLIYFKQLKRVTTDNVARLHKLLWNHSGAPVLVLISDDQIHVYSGIAPPAPESDHGDSTPGLVSVLDRVSEALREFLTSVESGEFFRKHPRSFDPEKRVDRALLDNLTDTRAQLSSATRRKIPPEILDSLLCRLVFTCYLFDRKVIGQSYLEALKVKNASHLRDVLSIEPKARAKSMLYRLFQQLGNDFNGDLFSDDLATEAEFIDDKHINILSEFFHGTMVRSGQRAFWPYDFGIIPIETISAIYERFLKESDEQAGAFYTPRFLAEVVLDTALDGVHPLLGKRFLDPACGSGIFLVGLFNRLAEEWTYNNPTARNDRRARDLMQLLRESLFGVDINPTACRITAFSLHLAYLDHLSPRDIQELQEKGRALPALVATLNQQGTNKATGGNIHRADFFDEAVSFPAEMTLVIGNPPWGRTASENTSAGRWCVAHGKPLPNKQIAAAFVWKAVQHLASGGRACLVLPHGTLFHVGTPALDFQKAFFQQHAVDRVLNLADFQRFLFEKAGHPSLVISYQKEPPESAEHQVEYWVPKADWLVTQAEVITIAPQDRTVITVGDILLDLNDPDAPQIWKRRYWATPRDWRFLDRLALYPRLRDCVRQPTDQDSAKPWFMAVGFQYFGENDPPSTRRMLTLPGRLFVPATSAALNLFLLEHDCSLLPSKTIETRRTIRNTDIFRAPHVLMSKGFTSTAYADFDVSFEYALRAIHGPVADRSLLMFLAAYLRTPLARYFAFHTSSNWGVSRQELLVEEVLRIPFPLPEETKTPKRAREIVQEVGRIVDKAAKQAGAHLVDRQDVIRSADIAIEPLVNEYFDVLPQEALLIADTNEFTIPSVRPTRARLIVPTIAPSTTSQRDAYLNRVCAMLNDWAKRGKYVVRGAVHGSDEMGIGIAVLEKIPRSNASTKMPHDGRDMLKSLDHLRNAIPQRLATLDVVRGIMVFDQNILYMVKPIGQRHWTQTAAMNDADEIAATILMQPPRGDA